jgi:Coenzyme PQQ synthesis protein D (PqqD)
MFSNNSMDITLLRKTEFVADHGGPQLEQVYVRSQAMVSRRVAGETLIVPVRGKVGDLASIYSFNQTGSLIWQSMESPKTLRELISAVQREYAVAGEQAEKDVKQFLQDTLSAGLVEVREQASMAAMNSTGYGELQSGSR